MGHLAKQRPPCRKKAGPIVDNPEPEGPAAYAVYLKKGSIPRRCGTDREAIMSIGSTTDIRSRIRQFRRGLLIGRGHAAGNYLHWLNGCVAKECQVGRDDLVYVVRVCRDSQGLEAKWLRAYACQFGELPPLNKALPRRAI